MSSSEHNYEKLRGYLRALETRLLTVEQTLGIAPPAPPPVVAGAQLAPRAPRTKPPTGVTVSKQTSGVAHTMTVRSLTPKLIPQAAPPELPPEPAAVVVPVAAAGGLAEMLGHAVSLLDVVTKALGVVEPPTATTEPAASSPAAPPPTEQDLDWLAAEGESAPPVVQG